MAHQSWKHVGRRTMRPLATVAVSGLFVLFLVTKVDPGRTLDVLAHVRLWPFFAGLAIVIAATVPLAWRWRLLLRAGGIDEPLASLTGTSFIAHTIAQALPTAVGGDAVRIVALGRRHPGRREAAAGSVLLERLLGGTATIVLAAIGLALAGSRYHVFAYFWLELCLVVATLLLAIVLFSRRARRALALVVPLLRRFRLERPLRTAYEGIHAYRARPRLLAGAFLLTLAVQATRILSIWLMGRAAGVDLGPRPYYVMGPLLLLVGLVPFTVNGLAVRESFFVSFLGGLGVSADPAFVTGFLYLLLSLGLALPGALLLGARALSRVTEARRRRSLLLGAPLPLNARLRYDGIRRALASAGDVRSILEIGAGAGALGARLARRYDYLAVEPDTAAFLRARSRLEHTGSGRILRGDVNAVGEGRMFDLVCAFEVLEHIEDDAAILRQWRSRISPGGWLLLSVPAHSHRFGPHDRLAGHYRRYDASELCDLLVRSGFDEPLVISCGFPFGYALEAARNMLGRLAEPEPTMEQRTAKSGRWFQPPAWLGVTMAAIVYPFCLVQRPFARSRLGTGLVVLARRADVVEVERAACA